MPDVDAVVIPVGGGGLIAGTALAMKSLNPNILIYVSEQTISWCLSDVASFLTLPLQGVESERCASFAASMSADKPIYCKAASTLADGLAVPLVGVNAFATAKPFIHKMISIRFGRASD